MKPTGYLGRDFKDMDKGELIDLIYKLYEEKEVVQKQLDNHERNVFSNFSNTSYWSKMKPPTPAADYTVGDKVVCVLDHEAKVIGEVTGFDDFGCVWIDGKNWGGLEYFKKVII